MDEEKTNEQIEEVEQSPPEEMSNDALKEAIQEQMKKVQLASLLNGSRAICGIILQYIQEFNMTPGKKTYRNYEKLVKKITDFCAVSLKKTLDDEGNIIDVKNEEHKIIEESEQVTE